MGSRAAAAAAVLAVIAAVAVVNSRRVHHAPRAVAGPAPAVVNTELLAGCPSNAEHAVYVEFTATAVDSDDGKSLRAESLRCGGQGIRTASQVQVVDVADNRLASVLIPLAEDAHFYALNATGSSMNASGPRIGAMIIVTYTDWAPGHRLGAMHTRNFTTTDGATFHAIGPPAMIAPACEQTALRLTADSNSVLRIVNTSVTPCVVEGYPTVSATVIDVAGKALPHVIDARAELRGATGGVMFGEAPSVILLEPRQGASAALDSSDETPDGGTALCEKLTSVSVRLAAGAALGPVPVKIRVCDFQTHPWVPGLTGSHR